MNNTTLMFDKDKANHIVWGYLAASLAAGLVPFVGLPRNVAAQGASILVGTCKELFDCTFRGKKFDPLDLFVTALAGTPVALLVSI
jgi:hypothetical protein